MHPPTVQPLPLKSGALQGALVIEYPFDHRFESLHIVYDGVNGQLPNLDLFNTAISIASGQMGIGTSLQEMWNHDDSYWKRLETILRGMVKQGFGYATGAHSSFMPYHIDAITIQTKGDGWQDEMALGRTIESLCRSLNNLLEHLHQSFFFYLLMQANRFVSIGTYLPSAMLIAGNFTIMAIAVWLRTGYYRKDRLKSSAIATSWDEKPATAIVVDAQGKRGTMGLGSNEKDEEDTRVMERQLALPLTLVVGLHFLGLVPLYIFNSLFHEVSSAHIEPLKSTCRTRKGKTKYTDTNLSLRIVLRNGNLHLHSCRFLPPPSPRSRVDTWPCPLPDTTAVSTNQIILPSSPRSLPVYPCDSQLLPRLYDRPPLCSIQLHLPDP